MKQTIRYICSTLIVAGALVAVTHVAASGDKPVSAKPDLDMEEMMEITYTRK